MVRSRICHFEENKIERKDRVEVVRSGVSADGWDRNGIFYCRVYWNVWTLLFVWSAM